MLVALALLPGVTAFGGKVLILDTTVSGGANSLEAQAAAALGYTVDVVSASTWQSMTAPDFDAYQALILGDPISASLSSLAPAEANRGVWGPVVDGNVIVIGTDPANPTHDGGPILTTNGIRFAADQANKTGLYLALSHYYGGVVGSTPIAVLDHFGTFTAGGVAGYNHSHIVTTHPALNDLTDALLSDWNFSVHEVILSWPGPFSVLAIADGSGTVYTGADLSVGTPYILASGAGLVPVTNRFSLSPWEAENPTNTLHTVCAKHVEGGAGVPGVNITFRILSGPNAGLTATLPTDINGEACWSYVGTGGAGFDTIIAEYVDSGSQTNTSNEVVKHWFEPCIVCPSNMVVQCTGFGGAQVHFEPFVNPSCTNATFECYPPSGSFFPVGTTLVTCGSNSCSFTITVIDALPPDILCEGDKVVDSCSGWTFDEPTATDNCCPVNDITVTVSSTVTNSSGPCQIMVTRTWQATDCSTNTATCSQTVTVVDTTPPFFLFGDRPAVECVPGWTIPPPVVGDDCCTNVSVEVIGMITNSANPCSMSLTVTWEATDCCGNTATAPEGITVVDSTPPEIFCPHDIFRYVCTTGVIPVSFKVTASDACDTNVVVNCTPASGSLFGLGVTPVSCTVTDACGNVSQCVFDVNVLAPAFWQSFPAGCPDCGRGPEDPASRGPCLSASYPSAPWKNFDEVGFDQRVGHSWLGLPANVLDGRLAVRMKPWGACADLGSKNDVFSLGLNSCGTPPSWSWSRSLGPAGADPGLQPTTWCQSLISDCDWTFDLNLTGLPIPSAPSVDVIPQIVSHGRLDMYVQDDTTVDYALLRLKRCAPRVFRSLEVRLDNAVLADAYAAMCLAVGSAPFSPFTAGLSLGASSGGRVHVSIPELTPGSAVDFSLDRVTASGTMESFGLSHAGATNGSSWELSVTVPACTGQLGVELRNGMATMVSTNISTPASNVLTSTRSLDIVEVRFQSGTQAVLRLGAPQEISGAFGTASADVILISIDCTASSNDPYVGSELVITAEGVPEIGLYDAALEFAGQYPAVEGEVVATVWDGQLVLSTLDVTSTAPFGLSLTNESSSEVRTMMDLPLAPDELTYNTNSHVALTTRGMVDGVEADLSTLEFDFNGAGWALTASTNGGPVPLTRVQMWHGGELLADTLSPSGVELAELPLMHWSKVGWFGTNDLCHRLLWAATVGANLNGTNYNATEVRVQADPDGLALGSLLGTRLNVARFGSLIFKPIGVGPAAYSLQNPAVIDGNVEIRWNGLGGVLQSATSIGEVPWTNVPNAIGGDHLVPLTNAPPASYFRVRHP